MNKFAGLLCALLMLAGLPVRAHEQVLVAVAANFLNAAKVLEAEFESRFEYDLVLVSGSSGKLYAQIRAGAPFEAFLSADQDRPRQLVADGLADPYSRFTYATGALALWSPRTDISERDLNTVLTDPGVHFIALANPELAPYGLAADQVLRALGLRDSLADKLVFGENIGQTQGMAATGAADLAFVAASTLTPAQGSHLVVPDALYQPVRQDAVLIAPGTQGARDFLRFLALPEVQDHIANFGYRAGGQP